MCAVAALAQVSFGAKVGVGGSNFWGKDVHHGAKGAIVAGLLMKYDFNAQWALAPEVLFSTQGGDFDVSESENDYVANRSITVRTNYINVPVMLKYYVKPNLSIDFGPQVGFNIYSKYTVDEEESAHNLSSVTNAVDFGVGAGITYRLTSHAFAQARYNLGLTKVFDFDNSKNSTFHIALGYSF